MDIRKAQAHHTLTQACDSLNTIMDEVYAMMRSSKHGIVFAL